MGIHGLSQLIKAYHISGTLQAFTKVAIDVSNYMYKYKYLCDDPIQGWMSLILILRRHYTTGVFVFDGKPPPEKDAERARRKQDRENSKRRCAELKEALEVYLETGKRTEILDDYTEVSVLGKSCNIEMVQQKITTMEKSCRDITKEDFTKLKDLLTFLDIPFIQAEGEADVVMASLALTGKVDYVCSADCDLLVYGVSNVITKIDLEGNTEEYHLEDVLSGLGLAFDSFRDLCILCGTDYKPNLPKIGPKTAYVWISENKCLEKIRKLGVKDFIPIREKFKCLEETNVKIVWPVVYDREKIEGHEITKPFLFDILDAFTPIPIEM